MDLPLINYFCRDCQGPLALDPGSPDDRVSPGTSRMAYCTACGTDHPDVVIALDAEGRERASCAELARAVGCLCDFLADGDARWADCGACQGRGYASPSPAVACATCHGRGTIVQRHDYRCPEALAAAIEARGRA